MKCSVIKTYIDKDTGNAYNAGDCVEYATDRARFLSEKGYVKIAEVEKAELDDVEKAEPVIKAEKKAEEKATKKPAVKAPAKTTKKK